MKTNLLQHKNSLLLNKICSIGLTLPEDGFVDPVGGLDVADGLLLLVTQPRAACDQGAAARQRRRHGAARVIVVQGARTRAKIGAAGATRAAVSVEAGAAARRVVVDRRACPVRLAQRTQQLVQRAPVVHFVVRHCALGNCDATR